MQEEVENRTLTLVVSGTKFTGRMFKAAISKYMAHRKEKKLEKQRSRDAPVVPHIRQSISPKIAETGASATLTVGTQIRLVIFWTGRNISVIPCWANPSVRTSRQSNAEPQRRKN